jgi:hypothetical protein
MSAEEKRIFLPGIDSEKKPQKTLQDKKSNVISMEKVLAKNALEKESQLIKDYLKKFEVFDK